MIRYPRPLTSGDTIGVTAPSSGVPDSLVPRRVFAVEHLRRAGFTVDVGRVLDGEGLVSGTTAERAAELHRVMTDPRVRAVVPPWGGQIALDLLPGIDWDVWAADPTWLVGFSDISTLLLPLTLRTGIATLHGQNLMDTPYRVPEPLLGWLDVVTAAEGATLVQGAARQYRAAGFDDWEQDPTTTKYTLDTPGGWVRLDAGAGAGGGARTGSGSGTDADAEAEVDVSGRLIGGCLETITHLAGTPYGDVSAFAAQHAPEGLVVYLESAGSDAADVTRRLLGLRYAGWFAQANAVLIGRTRGQDLPDRSHHDAVRHALGDLGIPVIADVDCGHVPPHLALINGALARVRHGAVGSTIEQQLS